MKAHWSSGYLIGLPIACLVVALVVGLAVLCWVRSCGDDYYSADDWRIGAWVTSFLGVALLLGLPWAFYPWSAQYHRWVPKTGVVSVIGGRFTAGTQAGDTSGTVFGDYVVQFAGSNVRYDCLDTRCALVHAGDTLSMSCIRAFQWTGVPGWDCNYADDRPAA